MSNKVSPNSKAIKKSPLKGRSSPIDRTTLYSESVSSLIDTGSFPKSATASILKLHCNGAIDHWMTYHFPDRFQATMICPWETPESPCNLFRFLLNCDHVDPSLRADLFFKIQDLWSGTLRASRAKPNYVDHFQDHQLKIMLAIQGLFLHQLGDLKCQLEAPYHKFMLFGELSEFFSCLGDEEAPPFTLRSSMYPDHQFQLSASASHQP